MKHKAGQNGEPAVTFPWWRCWKVAHGLWRRARGQQGKIVPKRAAL